MAKSSDSLIRKLKSFSPSGGKLDRDALIFAAGRASARRNPLLVGVVGALAASQLAMFAFLLWPRIGTEAPVAAVQQQPPGVPAPVLPIDSPAPGSPQASVPNPPAKQSPTPNPSPSGKDDGTKSPTGGIAQPPGSGPNNIKPRPSSWPFGEPRLADPRPLEKPLGPEIALFGLRNQTAPFVVTMLDGRKLTVKPIAERIGRYKIPPGFLHEQVRERLTDPIVDNPAKVIVLAGIRHASNDVPFAWNMVDGERIAVSTGEPLGELADLEIGGEKGPQAFDLDHLRDVRQIVLTAVAGDKNMARTDFNKIFGTSSESSNGFHVYPVGGARIAVRFDGDPAKVVHLEYLAKSPAQTVDRVGLEDRAKYFRSLTQVDRDFLLAFLRVRFRNAGADEMDRLRSFLNDTASDIQWTELERNQLLTR